MALPYIKPQPEDALTILDKCIVSGYETKDAITTEYRQNKSAITDTMAQKWNTMAQDWSRECFIKLSEIFVSLRESYNFRDTPASALIAMNEDPRWDRVINRLGERIGVLNRLYGDIRSHFNIKVEVVGRDKIIQSGSDNKIEVKN